MVEPWELILHHAYTGVPGVIFDQSPGRASHGTAVNLQERDFHRQGVTASSGSVTFRPGGFVQVPAANNTWAPLGGVRVELVCRCESAGGGGVLIDGGSFSFSLGGGFLSAGFSEGAGGSVYGTGGSPGSVQVPDNQWVTLSLVNNGLSRVEFLLNGASFALFSEPIDPINAATMVTIGSAQTGADTFTGSIDDVKVWRLNPHYIDGVFTARPVDDAVTVCWLEWGKRLTAVLEANSQCARHLNDLVGRAVASLVRQGDTSGADTAAQWDFAAQRYAELWAEDRLGEIVGVLVDLVAWLRGHGLDPAQNAEFNALLNDECFTQIKDAIPPMSCDSKFTSFLDDLGTSLAAL
jgi:hypothetical protein